VQPSTDTRLVTQSCPGNAALADARPTRARQQSGRRGHRWPRPPHHPACGSAPGGSHRRKRIIAGSQTMVAKSHEPSIGQSARQSGRTSRPPEPRSVVGGTVGQPGTDSHAKKFSCSGPWRLPLLPLVGRCVILHLLQTIRQDVAERHGDLACGPGICRADGPRDAHTGTPFCR
jgi:hypothetical protein